MTIEPDDYADLISGAIEGVDEEDDSFFYVQSFTIAESGVPVMVATWEDNAYQYRATGEQA